MELWICCLFRVEGPKSAKTGVNDCSLARRSGFQRKIIGNSSSRSIWQPDSPQPTCVRSRDGKQWVPLWYCRVVCLCSGVSCRRESVPNTLWTPFCSPTSCKQWRQEFQEFNTKTLVVIWTLFNFQSRNGIISIWIHLTVSFHFAWGKWK